MKFFNATQEVIKIDDALISTHPGVLLSNGTLRILETQDFGGSQLGAPIYVAAASQTNNVARAAIFGGIGNGSAANTQFVNAATASGKSSCTATVAFRTYHAGGFFESNSDSCLATPQINAGVVCAASATTDYSLYGLRGILYNANNLEIGGNTSLDGTLQVDGNTSLDGTLQVDGNVAIGIASATARLHVSEPNVTAASLTFGAAAGQILRSENSELAIGLHNASPYPLYLQARTNTNTARPMAINPLGGTVAINRGITAAITNALEVGGAASKDVAGAWVVHSDQNIKTQINTVSGSLDRINKIRLVSFKYKDAYKQNRPSIEDKFYVNVIAQEFQEIYPDAVTETNDIFEDKKILQVDTHQMTIDAVASIQELHKIIQAQQSQINELKTRLDNSGL